MQNTLLINEKNETVKKYYNKCSQNLPSYTTNELNSNMLMSFSLGSHTLKKGTVCFQFSNELGVHLAAAMTKGLAQEQHLKG